MYFIKCITILLLSIGPFIAKGAIYESNLSLVTPNDDSYSKWVKEAVSQDIFSNPQGKYFGIKTDCADAAFALRIIYAYEQKLPFKFVLNDGHIITQKSTLFDHVSKDEIQKLKALIEFIGQNVGSEGLAQDNTYSIDLQALRPGDLYISKWSNPKGKVTRHVYIIKDILPTGDLLLFSSTLPSAVRPLLPRKGMPQNIFKDAPFGFRRFLPLNNSLQAPLEDFSNMQYEAVKSGEEHFFKLIKNLLKNTNDTLELKIQRSIENICVALTTRFDVVEMAQELREELDGKCFTKNQYDSFSTPTRDLNISLDIERVKNAYRTIVDNQIPINLDELTSIGLNYLIAKDQSTAGLDAIKNFCSIPIETSANTRIIINIKTFYDRYKAGMVSSNPNESRESRWGLSKSTNVCPKI